MRKTLLLNFLLLSAVAFSSAFAQKVTVNAKLDSTILMIGDQAHLTFEVSQLPNQKVSMPIFSDSIPGGLELVEKLKADTLKSDNGHLVVKQSYVVTAFVDTLLYIPPFPFINNGDTTWSKSLSLKVVQPFKIDTASNQIADIKPVMDPKFDWMYVVKILLILLALHGLIVLILFLYRKYFKKAVVLDLKSQELLLPAHVVALNYLDKIKQEKSWQQGRDKEYHTELTEVLRTYIERMFDINSMEMTSEEILEHLQTLKKENKAAYISLGQILKLADLVKFAKWDATVDEHEMSLSNAYLFVNQTKIEETIPSAELKGEEIIENK
jgi:hypothetical protein